MAECKAKTKTGKPCKVPALKGSRFCFTHSPETRAEQASARRRGGQARHTPHFADPPELQDRAALDDLQKVWIYTMRELIGMDNSIIRDREIFRGIEVGKGLFETGELEKRIQALEQRSL